MQVTKCDICKKVIKDNKEIHITTYENFKYFSLCESCGRPVMNLLKKHKLIKDKKK